MYDVASYDVLAVDQNMPVYDGLEVIRHLASRGPLPPLVMVTGTGNEQVAVEAMKMGAHDYIVKDIEGGYLDLLPAVIQQVIRQHRLAEDKREADEALRQYALELEARNEELDAFAQTVAHDLENPLGLLIGYADTLHSFHDSMTHEQLEQSYAAILQSANKMHSIIKELLLLAEVRKSEVGTRPLDMASIVAEAMQSLSSMIGESQAVINLPDQWPVASGYAPWVEEVWVNYISNAVKYGGRADKGTSPQIELGADPLFEPLTGQPMIRFWVRDSGPGLEQGEQDRLFAEFTRLHQVRAKGHGLGLSIVRRIVEKLGGQVGVESTIGQGSLFYFTLPAAEGPGLQ
jgi:two-component system sensor histidine kinase/response regulator